MGLIAIDKFIREDLIEPFPKLGKQAKIVYLRDFERENLIHKRDLLHGKSLEELIEEIPSIVSKETRDAAVNLVEKICQDVRMGKMVESKPVKKIVKDLLDEILNNYKRSMVRLAALRSFDEYTFTHSVNVTILSAVMGIEMGLSRKELESLALGGMLHDVGKVKVSYQVLTKSGFLTPREFEKIKKHPLEGYKMVMDDQEGSEIARIIVKQHHERQDGSGYPAGVKRGQINNYAAIVAVADVYDALTTSRPYRKAFAPYEAMRIIIIGSKHHFNQKIVETFITSMSIYPQGSFVQLNTGEMAIVTRTNRRAIIRPVIKLLVDSSGERLKEGLEIDLLTQPHRYITGYVNGELFKGSKQ